MKVIHFKWVIFILSTSSAVDINTTNQIYKLQQNIIKNVYSRTLNANNALFTKI